MQSIVRFPRAQSIRDTALGLVFFALCALPLNAQEQEVPTIVRDVALLHSSNDAFTGVLRLINHTKKTGDVKITGIDDDGTKFGPATVELPASENLLIYATDLENGSDIVEDELGRGVGSWRLRLESPLNIEAIAYVQATDGMLTSLVQTVRGEAGCWRIPTFYSSDNLASSVLRLTNHSDAEATVKISGRDDNGVVSAKPIALTLSGNSTQRLTAAQLEQGSDAFTGQLGNGRGNWQLAIEADQRLTVMNLLEGERRFANLSDRPSYALGHCWLGTSLATADRSIARQIEPWVSGNWTPAMYASIVDETGVRAIAAVGIKNVDTEEPATVHDRLYLSSITKPMTATMIATLIYEDQTVFPNGWDTTVGEVFSDEVDTIHDDHESATIRELLIHEAAVQQDPAEWEDDTSLSLTARRLRASLATLATARPGLVQRGTVYYSHAAYMIAGSMAEKLTGSSWEQLMRERIFEPLGMKSAGFGPPILRTDSTNETSGHVIDSSALPDIVWMPTQEDVHQVMRPSGGIHASMEDLAKFVQLWMNGKEPKILNRDRLQELTRLNRKPPNQVLSSGGTNAAGWWRYPRVFGHGEALNTPGSNGNWYTLVWVMRETSRAYFVAVNSSIPSQTPQPRTLREVLTPAITRLATSPARSEPPTPTTTPIN